MSKLFKGILASVLPNATGAHFLCNMETFWCQTTCENSCGLFSRHLDSSISEILVKACKDLADGHMRVIEAPILAVNKWHGNYFHFMAETLPSLIDEKDTYRYLKIKHNALVVDASHMWTREALKILGHEGKLIQNLGKAVFVKDPIVTNPEYFEGKSLSELCRSLLRVRSLIMPLLEELQENFSDRIFIERSPFHSHNGGSNRRLFPQDRLKLLLDQRGYSIYYLENCSILRQAKLFSNANQIRAVHGAALTNIIFCKKTCEVVEFVSEEAPIATVFSSIAAALGIQNYRVIQCRSDFDTPKEEEVYFRRLGLAKNPSRLPLRLDEEIAKYF